ncbi:MAG: ABC transporter ATP-binding protein [Gammaproteobacteria bacterium]|nr:ABC transporter ATP-binding protein [Gammaproteobacteria bacterium]MCW8927880.1 ABC transporter ATP-binding protein [Gammaproteobacteria bacterium]MCW8959641.1 ABC transporter ATP-binding protein [Gammaproteobacteria bacterium]MCW8972459.1 ABC transporter ATP-binding protein [Gammaproteobacteria bacterium]MCW8992191.1 ABC transporter ATP-binding protein [Gammaproteobacteria bacterium]
MKEAVVTRGLGRSFAGEWAVRGLDLSIPYGEIFGLVGPDGAGKTTTLRMLAGVLAQSEGEAFVAGFPINGGEEEIKRRIAYMSQRFGLYGDLSVEENMYFYADLYQVPQRERGKTMDRLLGFSNLTPFRKRLARNLSGGMKQKLGLACALIHQPEVLFLDEPTNGVDPISRRDFWRILYNMLKEGVTIVVSTAYLDEAERCARVGLLDQGRLLLCDTPQKLKAGLPGQMYELESENGRKAREVLAEKLGQQRVGLFGGRVHLATDNEQQLQQALSWLAEEGVVVYASRRIVPSMEDVFIQAVSGDKA